MPSKAKPQNSKQTKKAATVTEQVPEVVEVLEVVTPVKTNKKRSTKSKTPEPVVEQVSEVEEEVLTEEHVEPISKKSTRSRAVPPTKDSVSDECNVMLTMIADEIKSIKEGSRKGTGVQFLNSLSRKLKTHSSNVSRVTKKRQVSKRTTSVNSGFLKPVQVSQEVSDFAGWKNSDLHSRTEVTKCICDYIKVNNLQNPDNRRLILPDKKLATLLSYDPSSGEVIRYCDIQRMLKNHFVNPSTVSSS
jgi:chromatin remodeling complex protein RSC6